MNSEKKKIVAYVHSGYNEMRNIYGLELEGFKFEKKVLDPFKLIDHAYFKLFNRTNNFFHNSNYGYGSYNLIHLFNGINFRSKPWITTFEAFVPRFPKGYQYFKKKGVKALASMSCKRIISLSENAKEIQLDYLAKTYPDELDKIKSKIKVIHPSQELLISDYSQKKLGDKITFTIVGADFFRKGGKEIVEVFGDILSKKHDIQLNIVSSLNFGDYASHSTKKDLKKVKEIINLYPQNIKHYAYLDNSSVLELLKSTHVALLPSYDDTYGYFVLEAQACGCPVVTTDIGAFPEINNNEIGYIIPVPRNDLGHGIIYSKNDRYTFSAILKENLFDIINHIYYNPDEIVTKGKASMNRINEKHNPQYNAKLLNKLYLEAIG